MLEAVVDHIKQQPPQQPPYNAWQQLLVLIQRKASTVALLEHYAQLDSQSKDIALAVRQVYCHRRRLDLESILRGHGELAMAYLCGEADLETCATLAALIAQIGEQKSKSPYNVSDNPTKSPRDACNIRGRGNHERSVIAMKVYSIGSSPSNPPDTTSSCLLPSASDADIQGWQHLCRLVKSNATVDTLLECYAKLDAQSRNIALRIRQCYCHRHRLSIHDVLGGNGDLSIAYLCEKQSLEACSTLTALTAQLYEQAAKQATQ